MRYKEDEKLMKDFQQTRNIKHRTMNNYKSTVDIYTKLNKKSMTKLLREAEREEKQKITWKERKLKKRLVEFRKYLIEKDLVLKTITEYMQRIQTIYYHYEIEIQQLPYLNKKNLKKSKPVEFKDLIGKDRLQEILQLCRPVEKAIVLFMVSSGCAKNETLSLTIQDFIDATKEYHNNESDINEIINILYDKDNVIPQWSVYRSKTNKYYTTFSSPESTRAIVNYLMTRRTKMTNDSDLFKYNEHYLSEFFAEINTKLKLGKVGAYRRFRSHNLRKFHASALYNDGMSMEMVNELQGKAKNKTDNAYFMVNPDDLRDEYVLHLSAVTISDKVNYVDKYSDEYIELKNKFDEKEKYFELLNEKVLNFKKLVSMYEEGDFDNLREYL